MNSAKLFTSGFIEGIKEFGKIFNTIVNFILLLIVYLLGVGITSICAKIVNKKFMDPKVQKEKKTYWRDLNLKEKHLNEYYRQF